MKRHKQPTNQERDFLERELSKVKTSTTKKKRRHIIIALDEQRRHHTKAKHI